MSKQPPDRVSISRLEARKVMMPWGRTSISLEPEFWREIDTYAAHHGMRWADVCKRASSAHRDTVPLPSACRTFVVDYLRERMKWF